MSAVRKSILVIGACASFVTTILVGGALYFTACFALSRTNPVRYEYIVGATLYLSYAGAPAVSVLVCAAVIQRHVARRALVMLLSPVLIGALLAVIALTFSWKEY